MGFRLRFLCPPPWSVVFLGLTGRGGGCRGGGIPWGGGGSITRNAGTYRAMRAMRAIRAEGLRLWHEGLGIECLGRESQPESRVQQ